MGSRFCVYAALLLLLPIPRVAIGADDDAKMQELERKLDQSLRQIQQLSNRVKQLEGQSAAPAPSAEPAPAVEMPHMDSMSGLGGPGVPFHGFADVGGGFQQHGRSGFTTGSFDMYLSPQFNDRVRALFEALIEFGDDGEPGIDLERAQIGYAFSDALTLWGGRFHTPFGYYNTAFHHGQLMQTSVLKPKFLDFEDHGGIMPSHSVGVWAAGRFGPARKFGYDVYVANAPSIVDSTVDMNNIGSRNHSASTGFNLAYYGLGDALRLGGHYYRARVADDSDPVNETRMSFVGPYAVFDNGVWEAIAEYYRFNNDNLVSNTGLPTGEHHSYAWFAQLGRRFGQWMPYARFEKTSFNQDDNYFALLANGRSYSRTLGGLRYDVNPRAALTAELNHTKQDDATVPSYNELRFQFAIGF